MPNIIKPYAKLLPPPGKLRINFDESTIKDRGSDVEFTTADGMDLLRRIEWCARISHRSEEAEPDTVRFLRSVVLQHGDWSVVEHATVSVDCYVDRGITHEIVRHRLFAFTQESTRFVNYEKKMPPSFVMPQFLEAKGAYESAWYEAILRCETIYKELVRDGVPPQIARSVFPNALASRIVITGNLRNWRHFLNLRVTKESHPQMREVTIPLLKEFQEKIPLFYEDIIPNDSQSNAMKRAR